MKKKITLVLLLSFTLIFFYASDNAFTSATIPLAGRTGAPGESTCANGCHVNSSGGDGSVSLLFDSGNNSYDPGATYTIQVTVDDASQSKFGFEATALDASDNKAGTFVVTNSNNTTTQTANSRQYISHKSANSGNQWEFNWTAPSNDVGAITFYIAGNAANGNNNNQGDLIYTGSTEITPLVSSIEEHPVTDLKITPTVITDHQLSLRFSLKEVSDVNIRLYSLDGRLAKALVNQNFTPGKYVQELTIPAEITSGVYIVQGVLQGHAFSRKIIIR